MMIIIVVVVVIASLLLPFVAIHFSLTRQRNMPPITTKDISDGNTDIQCESTRDHNKLHFMPLAEHLLLCRQRGQPGSSPDMPTVSLLSVK